AKIANNLGVSYQALLAANPQIVDPNLIYPGQVLNVPPRNGATEQPAPPGTSSGPAGPPSQPPGSGLGG
ncbi:MAG: LysM peptidoglycan-binding domain-containing protein, partial [Candidatus Promineifilaceae bacterium]|nr:LysM peptidoglycan-binding domain-containing protein [Candidatus Promineifilaceae bacterium]